MKKSTSSYGSGDHSASDSDSDPEREFSGDDDDRNHKHRRREIRTQSSEFDPPQCVSSRPLNKRDKQFQNGNSFRGNGSRINGGWKHNSFNSSESELLKPDRRHFDMPMFMRPQLDVNQIIGSGETYFGGSGFARGRHRDSWNPHDPRFGSMEFSQAANHGSVSSNSFAGRGLSNASGVNTAAWNPYGLLPGIPTVGLDAVHSLGINYSLRPPINPPLNTGIIREKCRDFEERGFCLRGDMCPMEHGVNRIVVDDVQSLSKFNLPVSIPGGNGHGVGGESRSLAAGTASASFSVNNTKVHRKMGKSKPVRKGINSDAVGAFPSSAAARNDYYDPDQPLLNKSGPESSAALSQPCSSDIQQEQPILGGDTSGTNPDEVHNCSGTGPLSGSECSGFDTHNLGQSSLGSVHGISRSEWNGRVSNENLNKNQATNAQGIYVLTENTNSNVLGASQSRVKGTSRNTQKPPQKAMRTVFVNGIPQKDNNIEALRSHFQKFGDIIDIYIPSNGERAFVQFSTREEAEAALKAPDAVMGNRFIKLWWANRDRIPDTGIRDGNIPYTNPSKGRINQLPTQNVNATPRVNNFSGSSSKVAAPDQSKNGRSIGSVALGPSQKKLESLEVLKEEIRKKQELLDQKRSEFKRQLDKLEKQKQATGVTSESSSEHPAKKPKVAMTTDVTKRLSPLSADISSSVTFSEAEVVAENGKLANKPLAPDQNSASTLLPQQTTSLNVLGLPLTAETENLLMNSSKLDNQPRSFSIVPPLPSDFADIITIREHFSLYGEVCGIELVNADTDACHTAIISFDTHSSAEKAFHSAKSWKMHDLQFCWVTGDKGELHKTSASANELMDVDTASSNIELQKEDVPHPDKHVKATAEGLTNKVTVLCEKPKSKEELVEGQLAEYDKEKLFYSHLAKGDIKNETQLSEKGYAEKTDNNKSSNEESVKIFENQSYEEDAETAYDKQLSDDEVSKSYPSHTHVDTNEDHSIEKVEGKT